MLRTIEMLYFAAIRDVVGRPKEVLDLPEAVRTVMDLASHLERVHPALEGRLATVRFAVNEAFAEPGAVVSNGDVVAVIPPVSGG
jgi:molybdopterin converting factor subunit 1